MADEEETLKETLAQKEKQLRRIESSDPFPPTSSIILITKAVVGGTPYT